MSADGGQAFPRAGYESNYPSDNAKAVNGMSLRHWLAGQIMPALIVGQVEAIKMGGKAPENTTLVKDCLSLTDTLIAELKRTTT